MKYRASGGRSKRVRVISADGGHTDARNNRVKKKPTQPKSRKRIKQATLDARNVNKKYNEDLLAKHGYTTIRKSRQKRQLSFEKTFGGRT